MGRFTGVSSIEVVAAEESNRKTARRGHGRATVPFLDLRLQYAAIRSEINAAVHHVMADVDSIRGQEVECFEWEFSNYHSIPTAVGVSSGTEALQLALLACGVGGDDEVVTPAFAPPDVADAICGVGAVPVFVDIDAATFAMDPGEIEGVITERTKVILPVHLYGRPADMGRIMSLAHRYELKVVESAGQAHGARYLGKSVGTIGDIGCFSCRPDDNLGAYGEAGVVISHKPEIGPTLRRLRDMGERRKYGRFRPRPSSRLDPLQAAVLRVKLRHLDRWNHLRKGIADIYKRELKDTGIGLPPGEGASTPSYSMFVVRSVWRDRIAEELRLHGIATAVHYPRPLHLSAPCRYLNYADGDFPRSEQAARHVLSLPIYPEMEPEQAMYVAAVIKAALG